jgi:hypothetical protein
LPLQTATMDLDPKYDDYDFPTTAPDPQPGHPGALTEQHIAQVHQFRLMLEAEGYTERLDTLTLVRALHRDDVAPLSDSTDTWNS